MSEKNARSRLLGRDAERATLDLLVSTVHSGRSAVLVLRGVAGIGTTAPLDHVRQNAAGCRIVRAAGVESEMELAFGARRLLAEPVGLVIAVREPAAEHDFSDLAANRHPATADRHQATADPYQAAPGSRAAAGLHPDATGSRSAARDPAAESFPAGATGGPAVESGPTELWIDRLSDVDARTLLDSVAPGRLDARVRDRIPAET
jgi:hypothetical protein